MRFLIFILLFPLSSFATNYYFSATGNDSNNGLTPGSAWKTNTKFNATTFYPGDSILFKSGDTLIGPFILQNSGATGNRIVISSYGGSAPIPYNHANRPIIYGGDGDGVKVLNSSFVTVQNLHVRSSGVSTYNGFSTNQGWGISAFTNKHTGTYTDITITNNCIGEGTDSNSTGGFRVGIGIVSDSGYYPQYNHAKIENVIISDNDVANCNMTGIMSWAGPDKNLFPHAAQTFWAGTLRYTSSATGGSTQHMAFTSSSNTSAVYNHDVVIGMIFTVDNPDGINVTQLGVWDYLGDGIASPGVQVGVFNATTKAEMVSTTVIGNGDAYVEYHRMNNVSSTHLPPGKYAILTLGHMGENKDGYTSQWTGFPKGDAANGSITFNDEIVFNDIADGQFVYPSFMGAGFPETLSEQSHFDDVFRNIHVTKNYVHDCYGYNAISYLVARGGTGIRILNTNGALLDYNKVTRNGHMGKNYTNNAGVPMAPANIECNLSQSLTVRANESSYTSVFSRDGSKGAVDAIGIDIFDDRVKNSICEYNWVHNNDGPAFGYGGYLLNVNRDNILRFNITYNNLRNTTGQSAVFNFAGPFDGLQIYNNLFIENGSAFYEQMEDIRNTFVSNNIFTNFSGGIWPPDSTNLTIVGNVYQNGTDLPYFRSTSKIEKWGGREWGRLENITFPNTGAPEELPIGEVHTLSKYQFVSSYQSELSIAQLDSFGINTSVIPTTDFAGNSFNISNLKPGPFQSGTITPAPPTLSANDATNTLSASHALGDGEIVVSVNNGAYQPYTGTINVGNVERAAGYWKFKIKSASGRNESAVVNSPVFTVFNEATETEVLIYGNWKN